MKVKVNKKIFISITAIIIIAVIIGITLCFVMPMVKFNQAKNKLGQINADELEEELITELERSQFNVENVKGIKSIEIKEIDDYINVFVTGDGDFQFVTIPILKIESDNNKFKGIEYIPVFYCGEYIDIEAIIFDVLENKFNIKELDYKNKEKLIKHNTNTLSFRYTNDNTLLLYINSINTIEDLERDAKNKTDYFGIDVKK